MSVKAFANGFCGSSYFYVFNKGRKKAIDPLTIMAIIQAIQALMATLCKKPPAPTPVGEFPAQLIAKENKRIRKGKDAGCLPRFRKAFAQNGIDDKDDQDHLWMGMCGYAGALKPSELSFAE